jgi:chemotaxis protein MotB
VMLVAFSNQDQTKANVLAGSMHDAFGVQNNVRYSGIVEVSGLPTRRNVKQAQHIPPEQASATPQPDEHDRQEALGPRLAEDRAFALTAASLRQALRDMPELTETSKHVMIEETKGGLNIEIVDQDGRPMFPEGAKEPYERTRKMIAKIAGTLRAVPYRIAITGHSRVPRCRDRRATDRGNCPSIAPMRCGAFSRKKACRRANSTWRAGRRTPNRCFPKCPTSPPIGA